MTVVVMVVCDSPKHARGKVATILECHVDDDGTVTAHQKIPKRRADRWMSRQRRTLAEALEFDGSTADRERFDEIRAAAKDGWKLPPVCKLCGSTVPPDVERVQAVIRESATGGQSAIISLSVLRTKVINKEQQ